MGRHDSKITRLDEIRNCSCNSCARNCDVINYMFVVQNVRAVTHWRRISAYQPTDKKFDIVRTRTWNSNKNVQHCDIKLGQEWYSFKQTFAIDYKAEPIAEYWRMRSVRQARMPSATPVTRGWLQLREDISAFNTSHFSVWKIRLESFPRVSCMIVMYSHSPLYFRSGSIAM